MFVLSYYVRVHAGLGQTGSVVLLFVGMNLLVQNHNHYTTANAIYYIMDIFHHGERNGERN